MALSARATERVVLAIEEFPRVAVNALFSLSYQNELFDEVDRKIIFYDPQTESFGSESWRCHYQVTLTWKDVGGGELEFSLTVREKNYGDSHIDMCVERAGRIVEEIVGAAARARASQVKDPPWTARFAGEKELLEEGFILQEAGPKATMPASGGLLLGKFCDRKLWLPKRLSVRHTLVCGPTGSGKSTAIFIPNLIEQVGVSAIVTEASPGRTTPVLYKNTAGWRNLAGHKVIYFNPDDPRSMRVNPVDLVKTFDDAQLLANLIVANTTADTHVGDQVWSQAETHLLQALLLHVAGMRENLNEPSREGDQASLGYLRALLRRGPAGMQEELMGTRLAAARNEYEGYLNNSSPNFRFGVVSGLLARLTLFANPQIAAVTEVTDFSMDELTNSLFTIYLSIPVHRQDYTPLAALIFNYAFTFILNRLEKLKYPLMLFLDEFTNFGAIPGMSRYLTVIRNAGIGAVLGVQDLIQMEAVYREKQAQILWSQPRTKIFFPPADDRMAERISKMLGTTTEKESVQVSAQLSAREMPRPLISASDLMFLEREDKYVMLSTTYPAKLDRLRSWVDYEGPIRREPPLVSTVKVTNEEEAPKRATPDKGEFRKAGPTPVPESKPESSPAENEVASAADQAVEDQRGEEEAVIADQDDFWSKLNRDFSPDSEP
jgi:type IV secretion system protein VirD4